MTNSTPDDEPSNSQPPKIETPSAVSAASGEAAPGKGALRHYMVHFIAREGRVSDAERAEAKAMLERHFGDFERFRRSLPKEQPAKIRKTIPMWFADESKPVDFVALLNETLKRFGYAPARRQAVEDLNVYGFRADWSSSEVAHFLAFRSHGRPNQFIDASVSLGHPPAEAFANETMLRYLPESYREIYAREPAWQCTLSFDLGAPAGWPRSTLDSAAMTLSDFSQAVDAAVGKSVIAQFQNVRDCIALFDLAIGDKEPFPWSAWGNSGRVAMAIYLGRKLGRDPASLKSELVSHVGKFKSPPNTSAPSAEEFVDRTLAEADAALARSP
jgi:hypothetical protein